ncbi:MAG: acylphosphatase [Bacteroidetes bacterium]|nr:acylphosphatase [Bacteroidota bacterium]
MIYSTYRVRVHGSFFKKGFGFSCMQLAYQYNITGTFFYESKEAVILEITGEEEDIHYLIEQCQKEKYIKEVLILSKTRTENKLTDFIMLNQID